MLEESIQQACRQRLAAEAGLVAAWLIGSAASDRLREDSDIDFSLLYEFGQQPDLRQLGELSSDLEDLLKRRVDLGVLNTRNLIYAHESIHHGYRIYCRSDAAANQFMEKVLAMYFDLKRDRRVVEATYSA